MNEELRKYAADALAAGMSTEQIRSSLVGAGWQAAEVAEALGTAGLSPMQAPSGAIPASPPAHTAQAHAAESFVVSRRNRKIGLFWLLGPTVLLVVIIVLVALPRFAPEPAMTSVQVTVALAGLLGVAAVVAIFFGIPLGILFLLKKELRPGAPYDERSGKGKDSTIPPEVRGWSWGAVGLNIIWGPYHRVWSSLLILLPVVNLFWWIVMGIKGNEWAWRKNKWLSVEHFKNSQRPWNILGLLLFILSLLVFTARVAAPNLSSLLPGTTASKVSACEREMPAEEKAGYEKEFISVRYACAIKVLSDRYGTDREGALDECVSYHYLPKNLTSPSIIRAFCSDDFERYLKTGSILEEKN